MSIVSWYIPIYLYLYKFISYISISPIIYIYWRPATSSTPAAAAAASAARRPVWQGQRRTGTGPGDWSHGETAEDPNDLGKPGDFAGKPMENYGKLWKAWKHAILWVLWDGWNPVDGWNPMNDLINHLSTGAGFLPSTVSEFFLVISRYIH